MSKTYKRGLLKRFDLMKKNGRPRFYDGSFYKYVGFMKAIGWGPVHDRLRSKERILAQDEDMQVLDSQYDDESELFYAPYTQEMPSNVIEVDFSRPIEEESLKKAA
jgi:hypothetical protein